MFKRVLLPLDGSARAEQAIPVAACLAHATEGSLIFLSVQPLTGNWMWQEDPLLAQEALSVEHEARRVRLEQLTHTPLLAGREIIQEIAQGSPATTILATAQTRQADLIVLCSHGRTGLKRWALGSVAQKIARSSPVPVLVLNERAGLPFSAQVSTRPIRVMVALDGSPLAERALQPAIQLSTALSAPFPGSLHLVHILPLSLAFEYGQEDGVAKRRRESVQKAQVYLAQIQKQVLANNPTISVTSTLAISHRSHLLVLTSRCVFSPREKVTQEERVRYQECDVVERFMGRSVIHLCFDGSMLFAGKRKKKSKASCMPERKRECFNVY